MSSLIFEDWGLIEYEKALVQQEALIETVAKKDTPGYLIFCSHPPIVTLGRKTQPGDVTTWSGPIKEIQRGGRATYHGPSQLVVYPIINLQKPGVLRPAKDIGSLLRLCEEAICKTLAHYDIQAIGKSLQVNADSQTPTEETGVWVGNRKIASLGIGVRKWISYHGMAINLDDDSQAFVGMKPCGFNSEIMVSLEKIKGQPIDRIKISRLLRKELEARL